MTLRPIVLVAFSLMSIASSAPRGYGDRAGFQIVPPHARIEAGASQVFKIAPADPEGAKGEIRWTALGGGGIGGTSGIYRAPFVVPAPGVRARILCVRGPKGDVDTAEAWVELVPGAIPGASDCLGTNQKWAADGSSLDYVPVDELPEVLNRVNPEVPASVKARKLTGSGVVNALVCRSGRVLDAWVQWGVGATPVPEIEDLEVEAVKQWVFKPGKIGNEPVATTVAIPFRFPPP